MAEARNWPPNVVSELTIRQIRIYLAEEQYVKGMDLKSNAEIVHAQRMFKNLREQAIKNLKAGKRWDAEPER